MEWPRPFEKPHPGFHTGYGFISWGGGGGGGGTWHNYSFFIGEGRIVLKTCKDLVSLGVWSGVYSPRIFFFFNLTTCLRLLLLNLGGIAGGKLPTLKQMGKLGGLGHASPGNFEFYIHSDCF